MITAFCTIVPVSSELLMMQLGKRIQQSASSSSSSSYSSSLSSPASSSIEYTSSQLEICILCFTSFLKTCSSFCVPHVLVNLIP